MTKRKIYVVGNSHEYANWMEGKLTQTLEEADLVLFTGGEDVSPSLYGEKMHPTTFCSMIRDLKEMDIYDRALKLRKHMIGICRGSQFLCVMNGGKLVQDQSQDLYIHPIIVRGGQVINVTSTHHQAQYPFNLPDKDYVVIGWADNLSNRHLNGNGEEIGNALNFKEAEIVYYPYTKCLAIQSHPEHDSMKYEEGTLEYFQNLLNEFLNDKVQL